MQSTITKGDSVQLRRRPTTSNSAVLVWRQVREVVNKKVLCDDGIEYRIKKIKKVVTNGKN